MRKNLWDWSEYTHKVEIFKSEEGNEVRIDHLQKGNSNSGYVRLVNDKYGLSVFGDFGDWVFRRGFIPQSGQHVDMHYFAGKLSSYIKHSEFDSEETAKELEELINGGLEEWGYEGEELKKAIKWFKELLENVDDELEYTYIAYRGDNPSDMDYDYIPFVKKGSVQLKIVLEAFNVMCDRLKEKEL